MYCSSHKICEHTTVMLYFWLTLTMKCPKTSTSMYVKGGLSDSTLSLGRFAII
uniref:Uncharacterized protein n=1 Tax=Octopus bimaculoides TaxID=37653 RepID=A0A0L8FTL0_OCTBM